MTDLIANGDVVQAADDEGRPWGLSDAEWKLVREHRAKQEEEDRRAALWAQIFERLAESEDEYCLSPGGLFVHHAKKFGWDEDNFDDFAASLMRNLGYREKEIRNHGTVWARG
jgi:hypothetical protein